MIKDIVLEQTAKINQWTPPKMDIYEDEQVKKQNQLMKEALMEQIQRERKNENTNITSQE